MGAPTREMKRVVEQQLGPHGISVNAIAPGYINTGNTRRPSV